MTNCEHKTYAILSNNEGYSVLRCTDGCGELLIAVDGQRGIHHTIKLSEYVGVVNANWGPIWLAAKQINQAKA